MPRKVLRGVLGAIDGSSKGILLVKRLELDRLDSVAEILLCLDLGISGDAIKVHHDDFLEQLKSLVTL